MALKQETIHGIRRTLPLIDRPHHQTLPPPAVASRKHALNRREVPVAVGPVQRLDVALGRCRGAKVLDKMRVRAEKAHGEDDSVGLDQLLTPWNLLDRWLAVSVTCHLEGHDLDGLDLAALRHKLLGHHRVLARVRAVALLHLLLPVVRAENARVRRPRVCNVVARVGGLVHQLEIHQALAALAHGGGCAVRASVTAANHHHLVAAHINEGAVKLELPVLVALERRAEIDSVLHQLLVLVEERSLLLPKEVHGEMDARRLPPRDRQVPRHHRPCAEEDGVELALQLGGGYGLADLDVTDEVHALRLKELDAALDDALVELHVGDAEHQQPSRLRVALKYRHLVAHLVELIGSSKASWPGANDGDGRARALAHDARLHPPFLEAAVDDGVLDVLDRHGRGHKAGHARALTGRWAHAASELGEVVGRQQPVQRRLPLLLEDELVPLGHEVVDGAAGVGLAEGRPAVHAPCSLALALDVMRLHGRVDLPPVRQAL
mmetsp:Transcript_5396/g.10835  ORF Transcript_5396/g.10835 Transcript_5396/m.10835 type:complete len:492 (+) Transcript_5396:824-2299(+)